MGSSSAGEPGGVGIVDIPVQEVWNRLASDQAAVMVDVRTKAEWSFVGLPDLSSIGKRPLLAEWSSFPNNEVDPHYADQLAAALAQAGTVSDAEIFFICRSGGRSKAAATALAAKGFTRCRNVADGFEGPLDQARHRGRIGGWKASGLPWAQG
ncbi:unnamed protein product [Phaeothamnion confervicola]